MQIIYELNLISNLFLNCQNRTLKKKKNKKNSDAYIANILLTLVRHGQRASKSLGQAAIMLDARYI